MEQFDADTLLLPYIYDMINKNRNHILWIIAMTCLWLVFEYFSDGTIDKGDIIKSLLFAIGLEFGQYCVDIYRKDNEETSPN
ncbi:MAG: hypothetical protein ACJATI_002610 [Halioglobus sp.]|jgi:hypothetical protein